MRAFLLQRLIKVIYKKTDKFLILNKYNNIKN